MVESAFLKWNFIGKVLHVCPWQNHQYDCPCVHLFRYFQKKCRKITTWDKRCIMLYWILEKRPIQVDSKTLGQKPLEWANRCIIDGKVLKVTKKKQLTTSADPILRICPINVDLIFSFCPYMIWQRISIDIWLICNFKA